MTTCLKVFTPLVKVLRLVDGDRKPAIGFIYGELLQAKEEIKVELNNVERNYQPVLDIIDSRIKNEATGVDDILQPRRSSRVIERDLHEDDFVSEEEENDVDVEYESDGDQRPSAYSDED
ncbi:hypothetical protein ACOSQ4_017267 [Xanthoceras sorbifolium]